MTIKLPGTYTLTLLAGLSPNAPMLKFYHLSTLDVMYVTKDMRPSAFFMQPKMALAWKRGYARNRTML